MGEKNSVIKILGGVFAFLTVILIGILIVNQKFVFITGNISGKSIVDVLTIVKDYMVIISLLIIGFAFVPKRGFLGILVFILYMAAVAVIIVFTFLPGVWFDFKI